MSYTAYNADSEVVTLKTSLDALEHVGHSNVDKINGKAPTFGAGAAGTDTLRTVTASDSPEVVALGAVGDAAVTNPASSGSVIALLKGLITIVGATLMGFVDGLETLIGSTNTKLDTLAGYLDGVEGKLDTLARQPTNVARLVSAASGNNLTVVKSSAGTLFQLIGYNAAAAVRYLKIYNKDSSPVLASDTPVLTIAVAPTAAFSPPLPPMAFSNGIAFALTTDPLDTDTGALTAGDILGLNILYA